YCGVRLFRQRVRGAWEPVLERIAGLLRKVAGVGVEDAAPQQDAEGLAKPQASCDAELRNDATAAGEERWLGATDVVGHEILDTVNRLIDDGRLAEQLGDLARGQ